MEKETFEFKITIEDKGKRLDKFLVERLPKKFSRSFIQKLVSGNSVLLNGASVKSHHYLRPGEAVEVIIPEAVPCVIKKEKIPLDVVYEDDDVIVINKQQEMVVHPATGNYSGTLVNALLGHCKDLSGIGGVLKPGIVHRIDKGTSGLLVAAKTDRAHRSLAKQFKAHTTSRKYMALVRGVVGLDNGVVELPIGRSRRDRKKMAVDHESPKIAVTTYKVVKRFKDSTLLELTLGTGRTHQIRVHMSYIGHPVLGDEKYGSRGQLPRLMLHARTLGFIHPATQKYVEFTSEVPRDMKALIKKLENDSIGAGVQGAGFRKRK